MQKLSARSIDTVKDNADILQVISRYISLKRSGANHTACCPFHSERSPSFIVSPAKQIYKCFGCGAAGDAIRFVMEHEKKNFPEAIETIAAIAGITLEYEERTPSEAEKKRITEAEAQAQVLNIIIPAYAKALRDLPDTHPVKTYLHSRGISSEVMIEWQIGWAGEEWRQHTPALINAGQFEAAKALGIIKTSSTDSSYHFDGYRGRITIPITDRSGQYVGLAGRAAPWLEDELKAKYINPADCALYNKSRSLFGLHIAARHITQQKTAIIVEGNLDAIALHSRGIHHVVATCGTAFTAQQMQLLRRYTSQVQLMFDNDDAGAAAGNRALPLLLSQGFTVQRIAYAGKDPDAWVQAQPPQEATEEGATVAPPLPPAEDAIIYRSRQLIEDAGDNVAAKAQAKTAILELIAHISNDILRANYIDTLASKYKWNKAETRKQYEGISSRIAPAEEAINEESPIKFPPWVSDAEKEAALEAGYLSVSRKGSNGKPLVGYYSFNDKGKVEISNFTVQPLFHVYAGVESRYLLQIYNGYRKAVLDMPAKAMPAFEQFQAIAVSEGNFLIFGNKSQWLRIASDLLQQFPRCIELKNLGWQQHGFFAWVDKIFHPATGAADLDQWGIYICNGENFLIPASCEAYRQLQHTGEDPFENDRHLTYKQAPVSFEQWAAQMHRVYPQGKGVVGVAGAIMALFRDIVFDVDNNCPHLYAFGEPSSGKSKWAESITALFYHRRPAFNLNSGTDFAFFSYMQRYRNAPAHLNEFEIEVIKPEWFQSIKGVYDGEGRERGKGGSKNRTEIMKVHSLLVLTGQKLITADDNSVVTRSLIEPFSVRDDITEEDKQAYNQLKQWEATGLSSLLTDLLKLRPLWESHYKNTFNTLLGHWRRHSADARGANQRILQNYAHLASGYILAAQHINLPLTDEEFTAYCLQAAIRWSRFIRSSDTISEFWRTLEFLADKQDIIDGWDYAIASETQVTVRRSKTETYVHRFDQPTKVLYVRLNNVHKLFQATYRSRTGKEAMTIDNLLHYMGSRKYFIGNVKARRFKRYVTQFEERHQGGPVPSSTVLTNKVAQETIASCYAFIYDDLGIEIERDDMEALADFEQKTAVAPSDDFSF